MISFYVTENFMLLMILIAFGLMIFANRKLKMPETKLFVASIVLMLAVTIFEMLAVGTSVTAYSRKTRALLDIICTLTCMLSFVLHPCVILTELLIILRDKKYKLLCIIPAVINMLVYTSALYSQAFIRFDASSEGIWVSGSLYLTIYYVQLTYLLILACIIAAAIRAGEWHKSVILLVTFVQLTLVSLLEVGQDLGFANAVMVLCIMEYYCYLSAVYRRESYEKLEESNQKMRTLTIDVAEVLANAVDAKDGYTRGHSMRVAEYSRKLAEMKGLSAEECDEVYYAALLHDVGKIGISESIITKEGKLTAEEYEEVKKHSLFGAQILRGISEYPYVSISSSGHHERYDGKGYPYGLKGTDIPEIARIISVADAYVAMSSKRSYRDVIPQQMVREELVKGAGTQFDPEYARLMVRLIDMDPEYEMSEREKAGELSGKSEFVIGKRRSKVSEGIQVTPRMTTIHVTVSHAEEYAGRIPVPSIVLFDSLDGRVHSAEKEVKELCYFEYGEIWFDGRNLTVGARKMQTTFSKTQLSEGLKDGEYVIEAVKVRDHVLIRITGTKQTAEIIVALPDGTRFVYLGLTGEYCKISDVKLEEAEKEWVDGDIPRIAEEISYINGPAGDIPNVQIDGYRTDATEGIPIRDGLQISFHTKNLPTARLVWHCPFVDIFCSDDGKVNGNNYQDLAFMRFDGEFWEMDPHCSVELDITKSDDFEGWDAWKDYNVKGYDATVTFQVEGDVITVITENAGICMRNKAVIKDVNRTVYAAITGDQVAITAIRIGGIA